jgi:hypothetical protein
MNDQLSGQIRVEFEEQLCDQLWSSLFDQLGSTGWCQFDAHLAGQLEELEDFIATQLDEDLIF